MQKSHAFEVTMDIKHLHYFTIAAKHLNFTKAAHECMIVQTAMSRCIASLEDELGVVLFHRNNRSVSLTAAGECFYQDTLRLLAFYQQIVSKACAIGNGMDGVLNVGYGVYERKLLAVILREFSLQAPGIVTNISQFGYEALAHKLKNNDLDVIIVHSNCLEELRSHEVETHRLMPCHLCVVLPRSHHLASHQSISSKMLENETLITAVTYDGEVAEQRMKRFWNNQGINAKNHLTANSLDALFLKIEAGMGISLCPYHFVTELPLALICIEFDANLPEAEFLAISLKECRNKAVSVFMQTIAQVEFF